MFNQLSQQVEFILNKYVEARNSDKFLIVKVLQEFYEVEFLQEIMDPRIPSIESIRRVRQKIQSNGKYQSSENIKEIRKELRKVYREFAATKE